MNLFNLFVKIGADVSSAVSGIKDIGKKMRDLKDSASDAVSAVSKAAAKIGDAFSAVDSAVSGVGKKVTGSIIGIASAMGGAAAGIAKIGVEYNAQMEQYSKAFETLLGSSKEATSVMEAIRRDAASTPFDVAGLVQANQLLIGANVSAEDARETILALGDAVAATGGGSAELARMASNLQQIKNVGMASAVDIKQFAMAGINIYQVLADYMGVSVEAASGMKVTYDELSAALMSAAEEGGRYYGAMEAQSRTFNGQLSNLSDNWANLIGNMTGGLQNVLQEEILPMVIDAVDKVQAAFDAGGFAGAAESMGVIFGDALNMAMGYLPGIINGLMDTLSSLVGSIDIAQITDALHNIIHTVFSSIGDIAEILSPMLEQLVPSIADAFIQYQGMIREIGVMVITSIAQGIAGNAESLFGTVSSTVGSLMEVVNQNYPALLGAGMKIMQAVSDGITQNSESTSGAAERFISVLAAGVTMYLPMVIEIGGKILRTIGNAIADNADTMIASAEIIINTLCVSLSSVDIASFGESALYIISLLSDAIANGVPHLLDAAVQIITGLCAFLSDQESLSSLVESALTIVLALVNGILEAIPALLEAAIGLIRALITYISDPENLNALRSAALEIVKNLGNAIKNVASQLWDAAVELINYLKNAFTDIDWGDVGTKIVSNIKAGIENAWDGLKKWFDSLVADLASIGGSIVEGIKSGAQKAWDTVTGWFGDASGEIEETVRETTETHSPSRVMERVGRDIAAGLPLGWDSVFRNFVETVRSDAEALGNAPFAYIPYSRSMLHVMSDAYFAAAPATANRQNTGGTYTIIVQVDGKEIASAVFDPLRAEAVRRGESIA